MFFYNATIHASSYYLYTDSIHYFLRKVVISLLLNNKKIFDIRNLFFSLIQPNLSIELV